MNCHQCHRSMFPVPGKSHFVCGVCQCFGFPTPLESDPEPIIPSEKQVDFQCVRCHENLTVGTLYNRTDVCFCDGCRGFVIDSQSVGILIEELRAEYKGVDAKPTPTNPDQLEIRSRCPACGDATEAHPYYGPGNCVLDTCRHCHLVWFDHGELDLIVRAPGQRSKPRQTFDLRYN